MATILSLYNGALKILGEPRLASTSEEREPRRALDDVYADAVAYCLEAGQWWFASKQVEIDSTPADAPSFGFAYAFVKPSDWVRTMALSADEYFDCPLTRGMDAPEHWYADVDPLYVRYVSDDAAFGGDLTLWPASFTRFVEYELAERICLQITNGKSDFENIVKLKTRAKRDALSKDAMNDVQPKFAPSGSFVQSRMGGRGRGHVRPGNLWRFS